jgi:hypothetical protein
MVENQLFSVYLNLRSIFLPKIYMIQNQTGSKTISKFYYGNQNFQNSKFWLIFGHSTKTVNQQTPEIHDTHIL